MKPAPTLRQTSLAVVLLLAASCAGALTLGRLRGAAVIGQPLDVAIPVRLEAGEDPAAQCFEADVFHGDVRVDASRVRVGADPGATAQDVTVRIRSAAAVDEPIVTLYVRSGCAQKVTRRYVVLSDVVPDNAAPVMPPVVSAVPAQSGPVPVPSAPRAAASTPAVRAPAGEDASGATAGRQRRAARAESAGTAVARAPAAAASAPAPAARSRTPAASRRAAAAEPRARLKLDPLDLLAERDPTLRSSTELQAVPQENDPRRAEAAAMWRALNAQPQDILRDAQRLQGLETDMRQLRDQAARNQASLAEVKIQLEKAQDERYRNGLVYGLGVLLLVALALAGLLWWRGRDAVVTAGDWWSQRGRGGAGDHELESGFPAAATPAAMVPKVMAVDVDLGVDETIFESLKTRTIPSKAAPPPLPVIDHKDFVSSTTGGARAVNAEELFDIQQQADFFVSLGQYDQAIEVLKNHISDNVETSALAYLDLLKIYHVLESRGDYEALREDFNRVFNAQVPVFDAFSDESSGLESYHNAMARIVALWPSQKVLEVIEESIFRKPGAIDGEAFDLEAYRELLMLYAIAKEVVADRHDEGTDEVSVRDSGAEHGRFSHTAIQPLSAGPGGLRMGELATEDLTVPVSSRLGLDIDLSTLPPSEDDEATAVFQPSSFGESGYSTGGGAEPAVAPLPETPPSSGAPHHENLIDFDLFDSSTEEEIAPRPRK